MAEETVTYLQIFPTGSPTPLPEISAPVPFRALIITHSPVPAVIRSQICQWLIKTGARYILCWGVECEIWHDTADEQYLVTIGLDAMTDDNFVMTTWHPSERLKEFFWFAKKQARHPAHDLAACVICDISETKHQIEYLTMYGSA